MTHYPTIFQRINWMLSAGILFRAFSAVATLSLTWFLTPEKYAQYSFAVSVSLLTVLIAGAGLPDYIVSQAKFGPEQLPPLLWRSWGLALVLGLLCVVITAVVLPRQTITRNGQWAVSFIGLAAVFSSENFISQAALRSIHQISAQAKLMLLSGVVSSTALVFAAWRWGNLFVVGLTYLLVFMTLFVVHIGVLAKHNLLKRTPLAKTKTPDFWSLFRRTFPYGLIPILEMALPVTASYLVITHFSAQIAGSFNLMITLLLSAMMIATVLDQTFYPILVTQAEADTAHSFAGYLLFSLFASLPAFIIFYRYAEVIANLFLFQKYESLATFIFLLAFIVPLHFLAKVFTLYFRLLDNQKLSIAAYVAALVWIVVRGGGGETAVSIGQFIIEGQLLIILVLGTAVLPFVAHAHFFKGFAKVAILALLVTLIALLLPATLLSLGICMVIYLAGAWLLQMHKDLLQLVR